MLTGKKFCTKEKIVKLEGSDTTRDMDMDTAQNGNIKFSKIAGHGTAIICINEQFCWHQSL